MVLLALALVLNPPLVLAEAHEPADGAASRYIVVLRDGVEPVSAAADLAQRHGIAVSHVYGYALKGFAGEVPAGRLAALQRDPRVKLVEADRPAYIVGQTTPTGVKRVAAEANGTAKIDGADERVDVDIAIIDTGIDRSHPDLNVYRVVNCANGGPFGGKCKEGEGTDGNGHGTHVAGTAAALDNGDGVVGMAPGARLWAVKVFDDRGSGYVSWVIAGVDWVTKYAAYIEVANMSLGWGGNVASARQAIQTSVAKGVVYVVAAGNESKDVYGADGLLGTSDDAEPAAYPEVATISALSDTDGQPGGLGPLSSWKEKDRNLDGLDDGADDSFAWFSNYSWGVVSSNPVTSPGKAIDLLMPGVDITSTVPGSYGMMSGTSMASPHAAGLAALYIAANSRANDALGVYAIRQALINGGVAQTDSRGLHHPNDPDSNKENVGWAGSSTPVNAPPTVAFASPLSGATVNGTVVVIATATDDVGVTKVEFFADGTSMGLDADGSDGWSVSWDTTAVSDGSHTLSARATNTAGVTADSDVVTVAVDNVDDPPTVAINSPASGATVRGTVDIAATASDDKGVMQVDFLVDGVSVGVDTDSSNGWSVSWTTAALADGSHTLSARVTDTGLQAVDSAVVAVNIDNTAPSVAIASPADGSTIFGLVTISAEASDLGGVTQVEFHVDGANIGIDKNGYDGWSVEWNTATAANGSHTLSARSIDSAGNSASNSIAVTIDNAAPSTMHVGDLDATSTKLERGQWKAAVTISVHDGGESAVGGATVTGLFNQGSWSKVVSCATTSGACTVDSGTFPSNEGKASFQVTAVSHATLAYAAAGNHDPDGDSDGASIAISK